jgi:hypothetical protein
VDAPKIEKHSTTRLEPLKFNDIPGKTGLVFHEKEESFFLSEASAKVFGNQK